MNSTFYKTFSNIIGQDVVSAIQSYFRGEIISRATNHTFLTLIPKRKGENRVEQFRSIALCNVIYNVIIKILAAHLKAHLDLIIYPTQSAFILNRSILDNIIINHEIMVLSQCKEGKERVYGSKSRHGKGIRYGRMRYSAYSHRSSWF